MQDNFNDDVNNTDHCYFIKCYILAFEMACSFSDLQQISKECFKLLPVVLEKALSIAASSNVSKSVNFSKSYETI